jgi:hypothetical protein
VRGAGHKDLPERPRLALCGRRGLAVWCREFRIICAAARAAGLDATFATLDELRYDGSRAHRRGEPVQLVYRRRRCSRPLPVRLVAPPPATGGVSVVNPSRSRVANNKKLFALFPADPRFAHLIAGDERDVIDATIPWTRILGPAAPKLRRLDASTCCRSSPTTASGSCSSRPPTTAGTTSHSAWRPSRSSGRRSSRRTPPRRLHRAGVRPGAEEMFPTVEDGHVQMRLKRFNINPFGIGGRMPARSPVSRTEPSST